jgi:hypothetical protein
MLFLEPQKPKKEEEKKIRQKFLTPNFFFFSTVPELKQLDPELYKNLLVLKNYTGDVETDFCLDFTLSETRFGEPCHIDLIPNGASVSVTRANRLLYIHHVANYKLNRSIRYPTESFLRGFADIFDPAWVQMFSPAELQMVISGSGAFFFFCKYFLSLFQLPATLTSTTGHSTPNTKRLTAEIIESSAGFGVVSDNFQFKKSNVCFGLSRRRRGRR